MSEITPYKGLKDPYEWVPENCPQIDDKFYFNVKYKDVKGGWKGIADDGTKIFYGHDGTRRIINKPNKQMGLGI